MVTRLEFNRFLMRHGAFKKFYRNKNESVPDLYDMYKDNPPFWVMCCGFLWPATPEGIKYWYDINDFWTDYLNALETNKDN